AHDLSIGLGIERVHAHTLQRATHVVRCDQPHVLAVGRHASARNTVRTAVVPPHDLAIGVDDERHRASGPLPIRSHDESAFVGGLVVNGKTTKLYAIGRWPRVYAVVIADVRGSTRHGHDAEVIGTGWLHPQA